MSRVHRRNRGYVRRWVHQWAREYIGLARYPVGVKALVDEFIDQLTEWPASARTLGALLDPYRKPWYGA